MEVARYHMYLDSDQRATGSNEDYTFFLKRPILLSHPLHYFRIIIKEAVIPYTFQTVTSGYNTLKYVLQRGATTYPVSTITIPNGNYNINDLITIVNTYLTKDVYGLTSGYSPIISMVYNRATMLVTFSITNHDSVITYITIQPNTGIGNGVATMLGIGTAITFGYSGTNVDTIATSTQPVNTSPITNVFIRSGTLKQAQTVENLTTGNYSDFSDILQLIPIYNQPVSWIHYLNELNIENRLTNTIISEMNLYLTDNRGYAGFNLQNIPWSCTVTIIEERDQALLQSDVYLQSQNIKRSLSNQAIGLSADQDIQEPLKIPVMRDHENQLASVSEERKKDSPAAF